MTAPHQPPHQSAFPERPYPQEPHQQPPVHPPVAPGQHLRPWPVDPDQRHPQHAYPDQPYGPAGHPDQPSGRHAADEELRRAREAGRVGHHAEPPPPIFVPKKRFEALAWTALVLGIAGIIAGVVGALVGPAIDLLKYVTIGLAAAGAVLGVLAIFGTRKVLAAIGTVLCAGAVAVTLTAQVAVAPESDTPLGGENAAAQDVVLRDCAVVGEGGTARAEATIEITNRTETRQSYNINVTVNDRGGPRVGEINAIATAVAPGESVVLSGPAASGTVTGRAQPGPADCRIADVNRLALGG